VERVVICEIDQMVIDVSKRFLPGVAREWGNPKVSLHRGDAAEFVKRPENRARFDVIVCDSSDPVGPAEALFEAPFFRDMADALRPGGCLSTQGEGIWMHLDLIAALRRKVRPLFAAVEYATTQIPTYPCGQIGFLICAKAPAPGAPALALSQPARAPSPATQAALRYYSPALHRAAFVLPEFARRAIYADEAPAPAAT
jgi:spermidine synthase